MTQVSSVGAKARGYTDTWLVVMASILLVNLFLGTFLDALPAILIVVILCSFLPWTVLVLPRLLVPGCREALP
jgi:TRAP-type C4-dicarboxylate transport system permease large subunit